MGKSPYARLKPISKDSGSLLVIAETPRGSRNKYGYDQALGFFKLKSVLPVGAFFPYDFGFIPHTQGEDGDPLDVLILMDEATFPGCIVSCRLIGNFVAVQEEEKGREVQNDRLIAVATAARTYEDVESLGDLNSTLLREIVHFFVSYNYALGRAFRVIRHDPPEKAWKVVKTSMAEYTSKGSVDS